MSTAMPEGIVVTDIVLRSSESDKVLKFAQTFLILGILIVLAVLSSQLQTLTSLFKHLNLEENNGLVVEFANEAGIRIFSLPTVNVLNG
jgi:hypothetical protein